MKGLSKMFEMREGDRVVTKKQRSGLITRYVLDEHDKTVAKKCTVCLEINGLEQFQKSSTKFAGKQPKCKKCDKKYRKENKERIAEYQKKYREENKEHIAERDRKYYEENKERITETNRKYREENKELINERRRIKKHE